MTRTRRSVAGLAVAGFQLAVRLSAAGRVGEQAGRLEAPGEDVRVDEEAGVRYARHTRAGARPANPGRATWRVRWWPPETGPGTVRVHVAANAADDDDSEFGDRIYADSLAIEVRRTSSGPSSSAYTRTSEGEGERP